MAFDAIAGNGGYPQGAGITISGHSLGGGSDRIVLMGVCAVGGSTHTYSTATYNGVSMTQLVQLVSPPIFGRITTTTVFYLLDASLPGAGTYSAQYVIAADAYNSYGFVSSYDNVAQVAPPFDTDANANNPAFTGTQTTGITLAAGNGTLVDFFGEELSASPLPFAASAPQTKRGEGVQSAAACTTSDKPFSSSGADSMGQTPAGAYFTYAHALVELAGTGVIVDEPNVGIFGAVA